MRITLQYTQTIISEDAYTMLNENKRKIIAETILILMLVSFGYSSQNVSANPIVTGELRVELFNEIVNINVVVENGSLISYVECKADMEIGIPGIENLPPNASGEPTFIVPLYEETGSENITIKWHNETHLNISYQSYLQEYLAEYYIIVGFDETKTLYVRYEYAVDYLWAVNVTPEKIDDTHVNVFFDVIPQNVLLQFPVSQNAVDIVVESNKTLSEWYFVENTYEYFEDFNIIEWTVPIKGRDYVDLNVTYSHVLVETNGTSNGTYTLRYAFGTGKVFVKSYERIELVINLPKNIIVTSYRPEELNISEDDDGVHLKLLQTSGFYLPEENVEVNFTFPIFNEPPVINYYYPLENLTIMENQNVTLSINASDPDNDALTYQWYLNNTILEGENKTYYTFIPDTNSSGNYTIKVIISDGNLTANHTWIVTVINVGQLQETINELQNQLNQSIANYTALQAIITRLNDNLSLVWSQLNESLGNNTELKNIIVSLSQNLAKIWNELNQSLSNNTSLQTYINQLNDTLNLSATQISVLWNQLNQSLINGTALRNQISALNENITNLQMEITQLKREKEQAESEGEQSTRESWVIIGILLAVVVAAWVSAGLVKRKK